jgi:hypothetical protein
MLARTLFLMIAAALASSSACAQVTIQSLGGSPITVQRDDDPGVIVNGGAGSVLRVGGATIVSGGGQLNIVGAPLEATEFLKPQDPYDDSVFAGLSVTMSASIPSEAAMSEAQRIKAMTRLAHGLARAVDGQCKLAEASFGTKCRIADVALDAHLNQSSHARRSASANLRSEFELAPKVSTKTPASAP